MNAGDICFSVAGEEPVVLMQRMETDAYAGMVFWWVLGMESAEEWAEPEADLIERENA